MSEEQNKDSTEQARGPGAILKQAREAQGLSTADIAAKLHLKQVSIIAIESDQYDPAISLTFTKGYLKLYAKQVKVPEQQIIDAFDRHHTQDKEPAKLQSFSKRVAKQANDDRLMMITYLIIAVVAALVVVWWLQQDNSDATSLPAQTTTAKPMSSQPEDEVGESTADYTADSEDLLEQSALQPTADDLIVSQALAQDESGQTESIDDAQTETVDDAATTAAIESTEPAPAQQTMPIELVFTFSQNCWMNLVDSTGEAIAYGVKKSGRVMPVSGIPPFEVTLGAPEVVQISYDGVTVDMSHLQAGQTAKFSLPFAQ